MRRYLLDTTMVSGYLFNRPAAVALVDPWLDRHEAATSVLVYAEVDEYLQGRPNYRRRNLELRRALREIYPYSLSYSILTRYGAIRRSLRPPHGPGLIGDVDTLIAATALERGLTVVTTDSDFTRVPGLLVQLVDVADLRP
jgi:predicted nucleic acid-binding protein